MAVALIVPCDPFGAIDRLVESTKRKETLPDREISAEPRVLYQRWFTGSQIASRPVAKPAAVGLHINALRHRKLSARLLHVALKRALVGDHLFWIDDPPMVVLEKLEVLLVGRMDVERDLKDMPRSSRHLNKLSELVNL